MYKFWRFSIYKSAIPYDDWLLGFRVGFSSNKLILIVSYGWKWVDFTYTFKR